MYLELHTVSFVCRVTTSRNLRISK